ncbi:hypothetical protein C0992_001101 [Termitomyces sp. T32_za158]|nr:hypothetical protein C0992_001101 [Termitomyces sp. T32_za158]
MSSGSSRRISLVTSSSKQIGRAIVLGLEKKFDIAVNDLPRLGVPKVQLENKGGKYVKLDGNSSKMSSRAMSKLTSDMILDADSLQGLSKIEAEFPGFLHGSYQDAIEQVSKLLPGTDTIGVFSGTESGGRPTWTLVFVGEEGLEGGSVPGSMGPLKSAIRGLTEAAATELGSYGVNVNSYFTRAVRTNMPESAESTTAPVDDLLKKNVDETAVGPAEMAEDVANVISFLTSKSARSISVRLLRHCAPLALDIRSNEILFPLDYVPN